MTAPSDSSPTSAGWDTYWQGAKSGAAYSGGGTSHPLVLSFWRDFFVTVREDCTRPNIVDIASGNGAVVDCARSVFAAAQADFTCVDISESAIAALVNRLPGVEGIVADARAIPLASERYDVVTSQFGIEYAGPDALGEIARLPARGGRLALLIHHRHGGIYRQCSASLDAISMMQAASFIPHVIATFEAGFAASRGGSKTAYRDAAQKLRPAVRAVEEIMKKYGTGVADGTVVRLYKDVAAIHGRLQNYDPGEVVGWLRGMQSELDAFAERMKTMCAAAIDGESFSDWIGRLERSGFGIDRAEPLKDRSVVEPLGWALLATKR